MPAPGPRPKYQRQEILGKGAFGIVFRVVANDGKEYAEKAVKRPRLSNTMWLIVLKEAEVWRSLGEHPNIVSLIEAIEGEDELQCIMVLMSGGELMNTLAKGESKFSEQTARLVAVQVTAGLAHLHLTHSMAHCDIKPGNLVCEHSRVAEPSCVKLCDFGSCQRFNSAKGQEFDAEVGTLEYAAPELVANGRAREMGSKLVKYGAAVDCWALGCVVYELLFGEPPYWSKDDKTQIRLIEQHELRFPSEVFDFVSTPAKGFIRLLLAPEPQMRMSIEEVLRHPWMQDVYTDGAGLNGTERSNLQQALPSGCLKRRQLTAQARSEARSRLQASTLKLIASNRLSGGVLLEQMVAHEMAASEVQPRGNKSAEFDPRDI